MKQHDVKALEAVKNYYPGESSPKSLVEHVNMSARMCPNGGAVFYRHGGSQRFVKDFITVISKPRTQVPKKTFTYKGKQYTKWDERNTSAGIRSMLSDLGKYNYGIWGMTTHIVVLAFTTPKGGR